MKQTVAYTIQDSKKHSVTYVVALKQTYCIQQTRTQRPSNWRAGQSPVTQFVTDDDSEYLCQFARRRNGTLKVIQFYSAKRCWALS